MCKASDRAAFNLGEIIIFEGPGRSANLLLDAQELYFHYYNSKACVSFLFLAGPEVTNLYFLGCWHTFV